MERLAQRDLTHLLDLLRETYAVRTLDAFAAHLVSALPKAVRSDYTCYNEINLRRGRVAAVGDPADVVTPQDVQVFERYLFEHPVIAYYQQRRDGRPLKISDFLSRETYRRSAIYNEFYRRIDAEFQMGFWLPTVPPLDVGIALNRSRRNFSERDRLLLNLLRPHLTQAYRNAEAVTGMQQALTQVTDILEGLDHGVVVLGRGGRVRMMTRRARQWLGEYFGAPAPQAPRLPDTLRRWVRAQERGLAQADAVGPPRHPCWWSRRGSSSRSASSQSRGRTRCCWRSGGPPSSQGASSTSASAAARSRC